MIGKKRFTAKMQAAHDILVKTEPGDESYSHHGFYSLMRCEDDTYRIQVVPETDGGLVSFAVASLKRRFEDSWTGFSVEEINQLTECAQSVAPVVARFVAPEDGAYFISFGWDIKPTELALSGKGVDIPQAYHDI